MPRSARNTHLAKLAKTRHANAAKAQKAQKDGNGSSSNHADSAVASSQDSPAQTTNSNTPPDDWTCTNGKYYPPEAFTHQIDHLPKSKRALYNRLFDFYGGSFNSLLSAQKAARWAQSWEPTADVLTTTPLENATDSHGAAIPKQGVAGVVPQRFPRNNKPTAFYPTGPVDSRPLTGGGQPLRTPMSRKQLSGRGQLLAAAASGPAPASPAVLTNGTMANEMLQLQQKHTADGCPGVFKQRDDKTVALGKGGSAKLVFECDACHQLGEVQPKKMIIHQYPPGHPKRDTDEDRKSVGLGYQAFIRALCQAETHTAYKKKLGQA